MKTLAYKLIAIDLDDSLLNTDLKISDRNKKALLKAAEKGIKVTIATGRMYKSALPYIRELNISVPVLAYQGAYIKEPDTGRTIVRKAVPREYVLHLIEDCRKDNLHLQIYTEDTYYFAQDNEYSRFYENQSGVKGVEVGDLIPVADCEPIKLLIIDKPEKISALYSRYSEAFSGKLQTVVSRPIYLEFTHIDATKGKALEQLSMMLGVDRDAVIAIGDSYNDISMIEYAGLGVAMGNSPEDVKMRADYVTATNIEDGVADVIEKFVLGDVIEK